MDVKSYFGKLNEKSQSIYRATLKQKSAMNKSHLAALDLNRLSKCCNGAEEQEMFRVVCSQLESSCLALSYGLYRSAFVSLRLSLEIGLGAVLFSSNKLAFREWSSGAVDADLKWSAINSPESGVFSPRFARAFFPELISVVIDYQERVRLLYRRLSEFVHGNSDTWKVTGLALDYSSELEASYVKYLDEVSEVLKFSLCCRYLCEFDETHMEEVEPILMPLFTHILPIRIKLGGPGDIV